MCSYDAEINFICQGQDLYRLANHQWKLTGLPQMVGGGVEKEKEWCYFLTTHTFAPLTAMASSPWFTLDKHSPPNSCLGLSGAAAGVHISSHVNLFILLYRSQPKSPTFNTNPRISLLPLFAFTNHLDSRQTFETSPRRKVFVVVVVFNEQSQTQNFPYDR